VNLANAWSAVRIDDPCEVYDFRLDAEFWVASRYPWLCGELYRLEGDLGWCPGFRVWDGAGYPPTLPGSPRAMGVFCEDLLLMFPDLRVVDALKSADSCSEYPLSRMLGICLGSKVKQRNSVVVRLYESVVSAHSPYTIGAARIYLSVWNTQGKFGLSAAGLLWLLFNPLKRVAALAETVRRKKNFADELERLYAESEKIRYTHVETNEPQEEIIEVREILL
jgi:hypothetical protein